MGVCAGGRAPPRGISPSRTGASSAPAPSMRRKSPNACSHREPRAERQEVRAMTFDQRYRLSRRSMFWRAAAASGLGAILKMTEGPVGAQEPAGQPAGRGAGQGRGGGGGMGGFGGGRGGRVGYVPINKYSS